MDRAPKVIDLSDVISNGIIDFLPGIFYVYRLEGEDFELIHWNLNHEKVTGYSAAELHRKRVLDFFYPKDFEVIRNGLSEILKSGRVKQVYANLRLKDGSTLPYLFEGYRFESDARTCFLGVGLDVSSYISAQKELDQAKQELDKSHKELLGSSIKNVQMLELQRDLGRQVAEIRKLNSVDDIKEELTGIEKKLELETKKLETWQIFELRFNQIHQDFFKKLRATHPSLSKTELRYLAYLKIKLSGFQIAVLLNVGKEALKKKRYRIRKKMGIGADPPLEVYVEQF